MVGPSRCSTGESGLTGDNEKAASTSTTACQSSEETSTLERSLNDLVKGLEESAQRDGGKARGVTVGIALTR